MAGAMAKVLGIQEKSVTEAIKEMFSEKLAESNARAAEIAYREVHECQ